MTNATGVSFQTTGTWAQEQENDDFESGIYYRVIQNLLSP